MRSGRDHRLLDVGLDDVARIDDAIREIDVLAAVSGLRALRRVRDLVARSARERDAACCARTESAREKKPSAFHHDPVSLRPPVFCEICGERPTRPVVVLLGAVKKSTAPPAASTPPA